MNITKAQRDHLIGELVNYWNLGLKIQFIKKEKYLFVVYSGKDYHIWRGYLENGVKILKKDYIKQIKELTKCVST